MTSWSSLQRLNLEDQVSLRKDLLAVFMNLVNMDSKVSGIMKDSNSTTLDIISNDTLHRFEKDIVTNRGSV